MNKTDISGFFSIKNVCLYILLSSYMYLVYFRIFFNFFIFFLAVVAAEMWLGHYLSRFPVTMRYVTLPRDC